MSSEASSRQVDRLQNLDVSVSLGRVPFEASDHDPPWVQLTSDRGHVSFGDGIRLYVADGHQIVLETPALAGQPSEQAWILQSWGIGLAWLQRGKLALHATSVDVGGKALALAGSPGAGKSTTGLALNKSGYPLLVDDVTLIEQTGEGVSVLPYHRAVHLLPDAVRFLGVDIDVLPLLAGSQEKVAFTAATPPPGQRPLGAVIVLHRDPDRLAVSFERVRGRDSVSALIEHTSRGGMAQAVLGEALHFRLLTHLASYVPIYSLHRPAGTWSMDEVLKAIEQIASEVHDRHDAAAHRPGVGVIDPVAHS